MCAASMITDHYRNKWGQPNINPWPQPINLYIPQPQPQVPSVISDMMIISKKDWEEYQELKKKAQEYDKRTNQPDCVKPDVDEWEKKIVEVLIKRGILSDQIVAQTASTGTGVSLRLTPAFAIGGVTVTEFSASAQITPPTLAGGIGIMGMYKNEGSNSLSWHPQKSVEVKKDS
jgi:hypothetical protein